ncbi:TniQ family protein [Rhizobium sp. Rhizsp82]|uniref:TniQ family protein n=1 Tax=Rhizobium sp. Rhizsp82 TaxID=3243057 RepID=UPI0039B4F1DB
MLSIPLHDDEVLNSYVSRLAYAHGTYRMRTFCRDVGLNGSKLKYGDEDEVRKLAELVEMPAQRLLDAAVVSRIGKPVQLRGHKFNSHNLKREYFRLCPHCLVDDLASPSPFPGSQTYYRAIWFLPQVETCLVHNKKIIEIEQLGSLENASHDFCSLLGNLPDGVPALTALSTDLLPTECERYIAARLAGDTGSCKFLDDLSLEAVFNMCLRFGLAAMYGRKANPRKLQREQVNFARNVGFQHLRNGESGAFTVLEKLSKESGKPAYSARGSYGTLYAALNTSHQSTEYHQFRDLIKKHALQRTVLEGTELFDSFTAGNSVRLRDVASELGVSTAQVRATIKRRGKAEALADRMGVIRTNLKHEIEEHLNSAWLLSEAADYLGCHAHRAGTLRRAGIIEKGPGHTCHTCDKRQILDLELRLRSIANTEPTASHVPIEKAAWTSKTGYAEIVRLILEGKLRSVGSVPGMPILPSLRVDVDEINACYFPPGTMPMLRAASALHLSSHGIVALLKQGAVKAFKLPYPRAKNWAVDIGDVERFRRNFISLFECHEISGLPVRVLTHIARRNGILPTYPSEKGSQAIYRREDASAFLNLDGEILLAD